MNRKALKIFLVCLILVLSVLDAPEYIRCAHIGLCEFLELNAHMSNSLKSDSINHHSRVGRDNFFSILENLIDSKELIKNLIIFYIPAILSLLEFSRIPIKREELYLRNIELLSLSIEKGMTSYTLKLLEISVILS